MYSILSMNWDTVLSTELQFKSNSRVRTLEFNGTEIEDCLSDKSTIVIIYNIVSAVPLLLIERIPGHHEIHDLDKLRGKMPNGFNMHVDYSVTNDGEFTDIILIRSELYESLIENEE